MGGKPKLPTPSGAPPPPPSPAQIPQLKTSGAPNMGGTYLTGAPPGSGAGVFGQNTGSALTGQRKQLFGQ